MIEAPLVRERAKARTCFSLWFLVSYKLFQTVMISYWERGMQGKGLEKDIRQI